MKKKKNIPILIALIIGVILIIPIIMDSIVEEKINKQIVELEKIGIESKIVSKTGYFVTKREMSLEVINSAKFSKYLLDSFIANDNQFSNIVEQNYNIILEIINNGFQGIKADGKLNINNYNINNMNIQITLKELSETMMRDIRSDISTSKAILPLLERGVLSANITFNSDGIKIVKLNDIDENFLIEKSEYLDFKTNNVSLEKIDDLTGKFLVGENKIKFSTGDKILQLAYNNLESKAYFKNYLEYKNNISIEKFYVDLKENGIVNEEIKLNFEDFIYSDEAINKQEFVSLFSNTSLKNINLVFPANKISIDSLGYKFETNGLSVKILDEFMKKLYSINDMSENELFYYIYKIINNGINIKFDLNLENLTSNEINTNHANVSIDLKLKKNNLTLASNTEEVLSYIDLNLITQMDEKAASYIANKTDNKEFLPLLTKPREMSKLEIDIHNSNIKINGKDISNFSEEIGDVFFNKYQDDLALKAYNISYKFGNHNVTKNLGDIYLAKGYINKALESYKEYLKIHPKDGDTMGRIGDLFLQSNDYASSIYWYKLAIENGDKNSFAELGFSYEMTNDMGNAKIFYELALKENQNNADALVRLGYLYERGNKYLPQDNQKAFEYYLQAAKLNQVNAIDRVAYMYKYGIGVEKNIEQSNYWINYKQNLSN